MPSSNIALATTLITPTSAQFGTFSGSGGGYDGGGGSPYSAGDDGSGDGDSAGDGAGEGDGGLASSYSSTARALAAHGILACLAFVVLFPLGAIFLRVIPGRWSIHAHWMVQMLAWVLHIAAFALGVELMKGLELSWGIGDFVSYLYFFESHVPVLWLAMEET